MTLRDVPPAAWFALGGVVLVLILVRQARAGASAAAAAVNPLDPANIFHSGANQAGAAITGDDSFTVGSALFDAKQKIVEFFGGPPSDDSILRGRV